MVEYKSSMYRAKKKKKKLILSATTKIKITIKLN